MQEGCLLILECDANAKLGNSVIKGAPDTQSKNGETLWSLVERNNLIVVNSLDVCEGVITRQRITKSTVEKAVLDYIIICEQMYTHLTDMLIDESRHDVLTKYAGKKGVGKIVESDHNLLSAQFNIQFDKLQKNERIEVFDYKNLDSQARYFEETSRLRSSVLILLRKLIRLPFSSIRRHSPVLYHFSFGFNDIQYSYNRGCRVSPTLRLGIVTILPFLRRRWS